HHRGADLDQRLDRAHADGDLLERLLREDVQSAGGHRREFPAVRPAKIHDPASGQVELEDPLRLLVDGLPGFGEDGREVPFEKIHFQAPLRLPIPSEPSFRLVPPLLLRLAPAYGFAPPALSPFSAASSSVIGPAFDRYVLTFFSNTGLFRRIHSSTIMACS